MPNKQDSNVTGFYIAEEVIGTPKTLPVTPIWYEQEPNSFSDFGGEISSVARDTINASRQRQRGTITDLDVTGGYNTDITQNNVSNLLQGFMFADTHEKVSVESTAITASGSLYATTVTLGSDLASNGAFASDTGWTKGTGWTIGAGVASSDGSQSANSDLKQTEATVAGQAYQVTYTLTRSAGTASVILGGTVGISRAAAGTYNEIIIAGSTASLTGIRADLDFIGTVDNFAVKSVPNEDVIRVGDLLLAKNFDLAANDGLRHVTSVPSALSVGVEETIVDAATQSGTLQQVGFEFATGDLSIDVTAGVATLQSIVKDMTELDLQVGEWLWIGGDDTTEQFVDAGSGFGRVKSVTTHQIVLDKVTHTFEDDNGSGKTIRIFFGSFLRNEKDSTLIKTRTYQLERQLGNDGNGIQAEYLEGAVANELTLNIPQADKLNADLSFLAMDNSFRTGTEGVKTGTRVAAEGEDPFNTSLNVYRLRMNIIDPVTLEPTALFGYVTKADITIKNNAAIAKAVGTLGGFAITVGTFEVGGSMEAYFVDTAAVQAVRNNSDVTMDIIMAKDNAGLIYDLPMFGLGGGRITVEKDKAIMVPLTTLAAEGEEGYTLAVINMPYLPDIAMPN